VTIVAIDFLISCSQVVSPDWSISIPNTNDPYTKNAENQRTIIAMKICLKVFIP
jgi:hypothetical protein